MSERGVADKLVQADAKQAAEASPERQHPERIDPAEHRGTLMASEHYVRYLWAADLAHGRAALDAGCGTGYGSRLLASKGATRVVGVDNSAEAIAHARRDDGGIEFVVAGVHDLPFADGEFDLVTCFEVIEHVERRSRALAELKRVLRPGGTLLISSPNRAVYPAGNPHHVFEYLPEELVDEVGAVFRNTVLYGQHAHLASVITRVDDLMRSDTAAETVLPVHRLCEQDPAEPSFAIVLATDGEPPAISDRCVLGEIFEVRSWHDRHVLLSDALARTRAHAEHEIAQARERSRAAEEALLRVEAERARERDWLLDRQSDLQDAHVGLERLADLEAACARADAEIRHLNETIYGMQRTRLWRLGSMYWQVRDRLLGRR